MVGTGWQSLRGGGHWCCNNWLACSSASMVNVNVNVSNGDGRLHGMHMHGSRRSLVMAGLRVNYSGVDVDGSVL